MPFRSQAQRRYLFATNPKVAREFASKTPKGAKLPEHVKKMKMAASIEKHVHKLMKVSANKRRVV